MKTVIHPREINQVGLNFPNLICLTFHIKFHNALGRLNVNIINLFKMNNK